jgi:hypothetical protein
MQIKINDNLIDATIEGHMPDLNWDNRDSKTITMAGSYADASALFSDGVAWSIVQKSTVPVLDANNQPTGETKEQTDEWDNSDYSILGDITAHKDGTVSIKMGRPTEAETAKALAASATAALKILGYTEA